MNIVGMVILVAISVMLIVTGLLVFAISSPVLIIILAVIVIAGVYDEIRKKNE